MPFQSGEKWNGNPYGRPVGSKSFTTKVKEALEKVYDGTGGSAEKDLIKSILKKATKDGNDNTQKLIWNYLDGMTAQKIGGDPDNPLIIQMDIERDKLKAIFDEFKNE